MSASHRWALVGDEMLRFLGTAYQQDGDIHWPTLVGATSALAGEMALLGNVHELPADGMVTSKKVADFVHNGAPRSHTLWGYVTLIADQAYDVKEPELFLYDDAVARHGNRLLPGHYPHLDVPAHVVPHETPLNAGPRHRKSIMAIATHHAMDQSDAAFSLATAAMKTVGFARALGLRDMTALVLECIVAGSRFVPLEKPQKSVGVGSVADMLPKAGAATITPPAMGEEDALWGVTPAPGLDAEPEPVAPHHDQFELHEPKVAFGRRR